MFNYSISISRLSSELEYGHHSLFACKITCISFHSLAVCHFGSQRQVKGILTKGNVGFRCLHHWHLWSLQFYSGLLYFNAASLYSVKTICLLCWNLGLSFYRIPVEDLAPFCPCQQAQWWWPFACSVGENMCSNKSPNHHSSFSAIPVSPSQQFLCSNSLLHSTASAFARPSSPLAPTTWLPLCDGCLSSASHPSLHSLCCKQRFPQSTALVLALSRLRPNFQAKPRRPFMIWNIATVPVLVLEPVSWITLLWTCPNPHTCPNLLGVLHGHLCFVFFPVPLLGEYQKPFKITLKPYLFSWSIQVLPCHG